MTPVAGESARDAARRQRLVSTTADTQGVAPTDGACPGTHPVKAFTNKAGVRLYLPPRHEEI